MGWMSWEQYHCDDGIVNENTYKMVIDHLDQDGWVSAGYEYMSIDDCWMGPGRDKYSGIYGDKERFPHGMKALADYAHQHNVKFGLYYDYGSKTCAGYTGTQGHLQNDANTLANWGVDFIKVDGCNSQVIDRDDGYLLMMQFLNRTGRQILYLNQWPLYSAHLNRSLLMRSGNAWRIGNDIAGNWHSVLGVINNMGSHPEWAKDAGPGGWNDPDMIVCGIKNKWSPGLNAEECRTQLSIWSLLAAPLMMSNKIDDILPWEKEILTNKEVLKLVHQDTMGRPGIRYSDVNGIQIWGRPLVNGTWAAGLLNANDTPQDIELEFEKLSPTLRGKMISVRDLWTHVTLGTFSGKITIRQVPPHDTALLWLRPTN